MSRHSIILSILAPTAYNSVNYRDTSNTIRMQGYGGPMLKPSLQKFYERQNEVVHRHEIFIFQMAMDNFRFS